MHRIPSILLLGLVAAVLAGCAGQGAEPTVAPTPTPTPAEIAAAVGRATQATQSLHYAIELSGKPVYSDATRLFAISSITGDLQRPDGSLAALTVRGALGVAEIRTVSLAGQLYFTNPVTRAWQCLPAGSTFDPSVLFDSEKGIAFLLQQGVENISLVGLEELDGRPAYHLRGTLPAALLQPISAGLLGAGPVAMDLWADVETSRAAKIVLEDSATDPAEPSTWTMTLSDYDKPVDVRAPTQCQ